MVTGVVAAEPLRVAFISQGMGGITPPTASGSVAIWTYETIKELQGSRKIYALEHGKRLSRKLVLEHGGATFIFLPTALNRIVNALHKRLSRLVRLPWSAERRLLQPPHASPFHDLGFAVLAAWEARKLGCEVIHIHNFSQFVPVVKALNPSARVVLHMHCEWLSQLDQRMIDRRIKSSDIVVGCSKHIVREIVKRFPHHESKCRVIYNGTAVDPHPPSGEVQPADSPEQLRILFVGRISPEKGVHVLIEAFNIIAEMFPAACLDLVGGVGSMPKDFLVSLSQDPVVKELRKFYQVDYLAFLKGRIHDNCASRVKFHGSVAHREVAAHYKRADVFVNSSLSDAFPVPVVEAMAAGLPMVASAVGGIPEAVVDESTGLLVMPNNPEALAAALSRLLGDSGLRRRMASAAHERALKSFSWRAIAEQTARVHGTLVEIESVGRSKPTR